MSRSEGNALPEAIRPLFEGKDIGTLEGLTFLLLTSTPEGWPYLAMLSVGEVIATGPSELRLALWPNSTTTANLTESGKATLTLVHEATGYSIRVLTRRGTDLHLGQYGLLAFFEATVEDVLVDVAPYAELTSGVTFRLKDPGQVLPRWQFTVDALRAHGVGATGSA